MGKVRSNAYVGRAVWGVPRDSAKWPKFDEHEHGRGIGEAGRLDQLAAHTDRATSRHCRISTPGRGADDSRPAASRAIDSDAVTDSSPAAHRALTNVRARPSRTYASRAS